MTSLDEYLTTRGDRFACCGAAEVQGHTPACIAATKADTLTRVSAATSDDDKARIEAAILTVARRGGEFSANDVRPLLADIKGSRIGPKFAELAKRGLIAHVGYLPSSKGNTHGHAVKTWKASA